jgi:hypothetical protein
MADETPSQMLINIMVNTGDLKVAREFSKLARAEPAPGQEKLSAEMRDTLSEADEDKRRQRDAIVCDDRTEQADINKLTDEQRQTMAALALAGYRFHRGMFYWRVISPDNKTVDSLQPDLQVAIGVAAQHNEERK